MFFLFFEWMFVLFTGGGDTNGSIQGGFRGQLVGVRGRLTNDTQCVSVCPSKSLIDESWRRG